MDCTTWKCLANQLAVFFPQSHTQLALSFPHTFFLSSFVRFHVWLTSFLLYFWPQIIAVDLEDTLCEDQRIIFVEHIQRVRAIVGWCPIYIAVECNIGPHEATDHLKWLVEMGEQKNVTLLNESGQAGLPGIFMTKQFKHAMVEDFKNVVKDTFIRVYAGVTGRDSGRNIPELRDQFVRFSKWPRIPSAGAINDDCPMHGKGAKRTMNDDGAMAEMINYAAYHMLVSEQGNTKYGSMVRRMTQPLPNYKFTPLSLAVLG